MPSDDNADEKYLGEDLLYPLTHCVEVAAFVDAEPLPPCWCR
jgi:hypothetical protein